MNRSVITGTIAAVVLSAGAAMAAAAPAAADPPGPGTVADAGSPDAGRRGVDRTEGTRKRGQAVNRPTTAESGSATKEPCPWPWPAVIPPAPGPAPSGPDRGGGVVAGLPIGAMPVVPAPGIAGAAQRQPAEFDLSELDIPKFDTAEPGEALNAPTIAQALPAQPSDATGAGPAAVDLSPPPAALPAPVMLSPPIGSAPPPPPAAPLTQAAIAPRVVPAPPVQRQSSVDPARSVRLGYPEELRSADITELAMVALPGLAAIAGMTALGGVIGYRQARAGYVLQAAGAGRFLQ